MSNNNSPERFPQNFDLAERVLNSSNIEDTYVFSTAPSATTNGLEIVGYNFRANFSRLDESVFLVLGEDRDNIDNNNPTFNIANEQIGSSDKLFPNSDLSTLEDILISNPTNLNEKSNSLLKPGQDYFVNIQDEFSNNGIDNSYILDVRTPPVLAGQITTSDPFYCCNNNENEKYYYDELNNPGIRAGENGISVGDQFSIELSSDDFAPVIFLLNDTTGEVIDVTTIRSRIGSLTTTRLDFTVQDNITYSLSIETVTPGETGDYLLEVDQI